MANVNFFDNYRQVFGEKGFKRVDPIAEKRWEQADTQGLRKEAEKQATLTPEDRLEISNNKNMVAHNNTLFVNNDPTKNAGWLDLDMDILPFKDFNLVQNSERLSKVLDEYDSKNNWDDRMKVVEKSWKKFPDASRGIANWLRNLEDLTETARNPEEKYPGTPKDITNIMRSIINDVHDSFIKKV